jgi:hypothetical protein
MAHERGTLGPKTALLLAVLGCGRVAVAISACHGSPPAQAPGASADAGTTTTTSSPSLPNEPMPQAPGETPPVRPREITPLPR